MDSGRANPARGDHGVEKDRQFRALGVGCVGGGAGGGPVVGQVVVVFDGLEGCGFAEEAKVVDWDGVGEEGLDSCK